MAREVGDTVEMIITSDEEESDTEGELNTLQQQPSGSVLVEGSQDVHVGARLTYNGPVTVNQIVQVPVGNSGYNGDVQQPFHRQAIDAPGSCTYPPNNTTEVNVLQREAETNRNATGGGQWEVPPHWQDSNKNSIITTVKKLLSVIFTILFISLFIFVVTFIVRRAIEIENRVSESFGSTKSPWGHQI